MFVATVCPSVRPSVPTTSSVFSLCVHLVEHGSPCFNTEWISDDLMKKIHANPMLRKGLTDPHFADLLDKFNTNPTEAMKECSGDAEAMSFFQQYCSLLGQHFTDLGSKEDARRAEERQRIMKMPKAERKAKLRELKGALRSLHFVWACEYPDLVY